MHTTLTRARRVLWTFCVAIDFDTWGADWTDLNAATARSPMLDFDLISTALTCFGNGTEVVAIGRVDKEIVAMIILERRFGAFIRNFQPSQLPVATVLLRKPEEMQETLSALLKACSPYCLQISLLQLDAGIVPKPRDSPICYATKHASTGFIDVAEGFDRYWNARPGSLRKNVAKRIRTLAGDYDEFTVSVTTAPAEVENFVREYARVEASGWKGRLGTAVRLGTPQGQFYCSVLTLLARVRHARLFTLYAGGKAIALAMTFVCGSRLYHLKTTYDEAYRKYAPGVLNRYFILERATQFEPPITRFELYGNVNESHRPFLTGEREIYHVTVLRGGLVRPLKRGIQHARTLLQLRPGLNRLAGGVVTGQNAELPAELQNYPEHPTPPFLTSDWFSLLEKTCFQKSADVPLKVHLSSLEGSFFPLLTRRHSGSQELHSLANFYTPLFGPCVPDSHEPMLSDQLFHWLFVDHSRQWCSLNLAPVDPDSPWYIAFRKRLLDQSRLFDVYRTFTNWYLLRNGRSYREYELSLPGALRSTIERGKRKLALMGQSRIDLFSSRNDDRNLGKALQLFQSVYSKSWKIEEPFPQFIPGLFELANARGWLRVGVLHVGGFPAAAQLWLHCGKASYIFKLAYDRAFSSYSPGTVLTSAMMQQALDIDNAESVDFLLGDEPFKKDWMSHQRTRLGVVVFNRKSLVGIGDAALHFGGSALRKGLRSVRSNTSDS